jgi:hypothetical protein
MAIAALPNKAKLEIKKTFMANGGVFLLSGRLVLQYNLDLKTVAFSKANDT